MSVLNKLTRDFKLKLKETIKEKHDFYLNSNFLMYKKKLPLSKDDLNYETVLTKLDSKLYYIFSKSKKEIEERETEWLKLGVFLDWFYEEKGIYMTSFKSFCFNKNKNDILDRYRYYVELLADGGNAFKDKDMHRKICFMVYEQTSFGEDSDDNEEEDEEESEDEEEQPRELTEHEQELLDDYNREEERGARQEALEIEQQSNERRRLNNSELLEILRGYSDSGTFHLEISDSGLERVTRRDGEQVQIIYSIQDGIIPEPIEDEQDEQDTARSRQVLENLKKQNTPKKTFYEEKCVICLEKNQMYFFVIVVIYLYAQIVMI